MMVARSGESVTLLGADFPFSGVKHRPAIPAGII